jgi:hypothetical protein
VHECHPPVVAAILVAAGMLLGKRYRRTPRSSPAPSVPKSEWVLAAGLALLPLITVPASFLIGYFSDRNLLPMMVGVSATVAFIGQRYLASRAAAIALTAIFLIWFGVHTVTTIDAQMKQTGGYPFYTSQPLDAQDWIDDAGRSDLPIVISDCVMYLQFQKYARPEIQRRLTHPISRQHSLEVIHEYTGETNLITLGQIKTDLWLPPYEDFIRDHRTFLLVDSAYRRWAIFQLQKEGARLQVMFEGQYDRLFKVTMP